MSSSSKPLAQKRLGRGLNAIFDTEDFVIKDKIARPNSSICEVEIDKIDPNATQPRQLFDQEAITELSESISALGLIQPITLRENGDGRYTIISGERRFRASKLAGLTQLPAYIRKVDDSTMLEMALVENIQREELTSIEIAFTLNRLIDECGITQEKLSERVGKKRSTISNYIRLLKLPAEIQLSLGENIISMGHAKAIMGVEEKEMQIDVLKRVVKDALSVRQTEELVKSIVEQSISSVNKVSKPEIAMPENVTRLNSKLSDLLGKKVTINRNAKGRGKIVIEFKNDRDIDDILSKFE